MRLSTLHSMCPEQNSEEKWLLKRKRIAVFSSSFAKKIRHVCQKCNLHFQRRFQGKIDFLERYSILWGFSDFAQNVFSYLGKTFCRGWQNLILSVQMKISMQYTSITKQHFIIFLEIFCEKIPACLSKKESTFAEEVLQEKQTFFLKTFHVKNYGLWAKNVQKRHSFIETLTKLRYTCGGNACR